MEVTVDPADKVTQKQVRFSTLSCQFGSLFQVDENLILMRRIEAIVRWYTLQREIAIST